MEENLSNEIQNNKSQKGGNMLNQIIIAGNLGKDPEMFYSSEGNAIASFSLAFRGSKKDKTGWLKVTAFGKLAEIVEKYLHKGARVAVSGILDSNKWKTDDGQNRTSFKIIANNLEFIKTDGRGFENGQDKEDIPF